jgi:hypothetical protein
MALTKAPTGITELRNLLSMLIANLDNSLVKVPVAKEMNNTAGKIIGTLKVELEAAALRKEPPDIAYLK